MSTRAWFDPVARGSRLRAALDALQPVPDPDAAGVGPPFVLDAGAGRLLVTPEGRELDRLLRCALAESADERAADQIRLGWERTDEADRRVLETYRSLARGRLQSVVRLRAGGAAPMLPQAVGLVLLLLLNGNVGPSHALAPPAMEPDRRAVDEAVADMTGAFADALAPSRPGRRRTPSAYSLYGGYAVSEARRRLGHDLAADPVFLAEGSERRTLDRLALELRRRPGVDEVTVGRAVDRLAEAYQARRPVLASYGLAGGRPAAAAELRRRLVEAYQAAA